LSENHVPFRTGRDLTLIPKQATGPINFLIYPHVNITGKVHLVPGLTSLQERKSVSRMRSWRMRYAKQAGFIPGKWSWPA
jgi:hypothetical protein